MVRSRVSETGKAGPCITLCSLVSSSTHLLLQQQTSAVLRCVYDDARYVVFMRLTSIHGSGMMSMVDPPSVPTVPPTPDLKSGVWPTASQPTSMQPLSNEAASLRFTRIHLAYPSDPASLERSGEGRGSCSAPAPLTNDPLLGTVANSCDVWVAMEE